MSGWKSISGDTEDRSYVPQQTTDYINPDVFYRLAEKDKNLQIYTFLYERRLGLVYDWGGKSHHVLLRELDSEYDMRIGNYPNTPADPDDLAMFFYIDKLFTKFSTNYNSFAKIVLVGRTVKLEGPQLENMSTKGDWLVTFWNDNGEVYEQLLPECMLALYDHNLLEDPVIMSTPIWGTRPYTTAETVSIHKDPTPRIGQAELEKMRQLHLMRGDEKKKAMDELGLASTSQKHPMQAAMEKGGYITPGQKWWAPTSESLFRRRLDKALNEIPQP